MFVIRAEQVDVVSSREEKQKRLHWNERGKTPDVGLEEEETPWCNLVGGIYHQNQNDSSKYGEYPMISFQILILQAKVMKTDDKSAEKSAMAKPGFENWLKSSLLFLGASLRSKKKHVLQITVRNCTLNPPTLKEFCCEATSASVLMRTKICFTSGVMATNPAASMRRTDGRMGRWVSTLRLGV